MLQTNEFKFNVAMINERTVELGEKMMSQLIFCNSAITALFGGIKCIPKSATALGVAGWLAGCASLILKVMEIHREKIVTTALCHVNVRARYFSEMLLTLQRI